ncbi:hypothetical protein GCM10009646_57000 [Streptomyces aureus]
MRRRNLQCRPRALSGGLAEEAGNGSEGQSDDGGDGAADGTKDVGDGCELEGAVGHGAFQFGVVKAGVVGTTKACRHSVTARSRPPALGRRAGLTPFSGPSCRSTTVT